MIDTSPSPADGKWYDREGMLKRQDELVRTMPTGTDWYWRTSDGSTVAFGGRSKLSQQLNVKPRSQESGTQAGSNRANILRRES